MQGQLPIWVEYVRALGTPFAAVVFGFFAAWLSYRQWKISVYRYRFDLFHERYELYSALLDLFGDIMRNNKVSAEVYSKFAVAANKAKFLFDDEIDLYLTKLTDTLFEKNSLERKMKRNVSDADFKELSDQADRNWDMIFKMMKESAAIFSKYLKIPK
jgi:hypothetical protein